MADPANPVEVGFVDTPGEAYGVAVAGEYVYVADYDAGLRVVNIADPANPVEVGFYYTHTLGQAHGVAAVGGYAYVTDLDSGLWILQYVESQYVQSVYLPVALRG